MNWIALRNLVAIVAFIIVLFIAIASTDAPGATGRPKFVSPFAWAVSMCETRGDFRHDGGSYEGFVGWFTGTWLLDRRKGYPDHADEATPRQQNRVFHDSLARGRYFGCIANGGYRSHL